MQRGRQVASSKVSNKKGTQGAEKYTWCRKEDGVEKNEVREGRQVQKGTEGAGR